MTASIASLIDHSLLHPTLTDEDLGHGCAVAETYCVASVCVKPCDVAKAAELLANSGVAVGTVVGFPHGAHLTETKALEARRACEQGATELDMVVNVGRVLGQDWAYVQADIQAVSDVAHEMKALTKVIFENDFLPHDVYKIRLCEICRECGVEFVKTSTGFGFVKQPQGQYAYHGATEADIRLMLEHCGPSIKVKAAGGIRDYATALHLRDLGVARIGATATATIVSEEQAALRDISG